MECSEQWNRDLEPTDSVKNVGDASECQVNVEEGMLKSNVGGGVLCLTWWERPQSGRAQSGRKQMTHGRSGSRAE